jgi:hypothetical protein
VIAKRACILLLTLPLGCGSNNGSTPGPGPADAGGTDGSAGTVDAPPPPPADMVTGTQLETCPDVSTGTAAGTVVQPFDLRNSIVQAWIPDATAPTGFRIQPGIGLADGTFEIKGVPVGTHYLLQIDDTNFFATDQRKINGNFIASARCNPQFTFTPVPVTLEMTNLTPAGDLDEVGVFSFSNAESQQAITNLAAGSTTLDATVNWFNALVDSDVGDDFTLLHVHADTQSDPATGKFRQFDHIVDSFVSHHVRLLSGSAAVDGAFTPTTTATLPIAIDAAPYIAPYLAQSAAFDFNVELNAGPFNAVPLGGGDLGGISVFDADLSTLSLNDTITYADPFPATWSRAVLASAGMDRFYFVAPKAGFFFINTGGEQQVGYTGTPAPTFQAMIPPATGLQINGLDVDNGRAIPFDGKAPITASWQAAAGAALYNVDVWQVDVGSTTNTGKHIATFTTADTSIVIPASLFANDRFYAFSLGAFDQPPGPGLADGVLFQPPVTFRQATIASARLRFSPTCGDGVVDPGEDCDDKGESATCNADCTKSMCGDGILNTTAGEACDTVFDTTVCASLTCTLLTAPTAPVRAHTVPRTLHRERIAPTTRLPTRARAGSIAMPARSGH